jgi:hypothetical protein
MSLRNAIDKALRSHYPEAQISVTAPTPRPAPDDWYVTVEGAPELQDEVMTFATAFAEGWWAARETEGKP